MARAPVEADRYCESDVRTHRGRRKHDHLSRESGPEGIQRRRNQIRGLITHKWLAAGSKDTEESDIVGGGLSGRKGIGQWGVLSCWFTDSQPV